MQEVKTFETVTWDAIRQQVSRVNTELGQAIDASLRDKSKRPKFLLFSYPYGSDIIHNNKFILPPTISDCPAHDFRDKFAPFGVPLAIVLDKALEIYTTGSDKLTHPLRVLYPGELFGAFEATDWLSGALQASVSTYSISSGLRSIWIVAPLGDQRLKQASLRGKTHFDVAVNLAQSEEPSWISKVVCLPYSLLKVEGRPSELGYYIIKTAWLQSAVHRHQYALDQQIMDCCEGDSKCLAYVEVVKHILNVGRGLTPAHRAWDDPENIGGPFAQVQSKLKSIADTLRIRKFPEPYILRPVQLKNPGDYGFYSFCEGVPSLPLSAKLPKYGPEQARQVCALLLKNRLPHLLPHEVDLNTSLGLPVRLKFYCRGNLKLGVARGGQPFSNHGNLELSDFLGPRLQGESEIRRRDKFLLACVRIERT